MIVVKFWFTFLSFLLNYYIDILHITLHSIIIIENMIYFYSL